jgi:hypothetical protein
MTNKVRYERPRAGLTWNMTTEEPILIIDYGLRRVRLTYSTPAAKDLSRELWDQSQWCSETFRAETCSYWDHRWFFKRPQDLTMFLMRWS